MAASFERIPDCGGIVLCGGKSLRMGRDKGALLFEGETFLQRIVRIVSGCVSPVVVVGSIGETHPQGHAELRILPDEFPGCGPLAGIMTGLAELKGACSRAIVVTCDAPLISEHVLLGLAMGTTSRDVAVVLPSDDSRTHHFPSLWKTRLVENLREELRDSHFKVGRFLESVPTHRLSPEFCRTLDPTLRFLENINTPEDYQRLLDCLPLISRVDEKI